MNEGPIPRKLGVTTQKVFGKTIADLVGEEAASEVLPYFERAFSGEVTSYELALGDAVFQTVLSPVEEDGKIVEVAGSSYDITERRQLQEESNKNRQVLEKAEILSNQGAWEWDIANDRWTFSENWLRIHGCGATGISKEELMAVAHPDDRARVENALQAALAGKDVYSVEHRIVRQDDQSIRVVQALGEVGFDEHGQPLKMFGVAQDITERKRAEEEIKDSRDRLRQLTARLDQVREEERKALARELHDDVGQNLTALKMDLAGFEEEIPDEMKHLTDRLDSMIALTQDSVDRLNRLSSELRSPILHMLGLEQAVESEVRDYRERWNTEIDLQMDLGGVETSPDRDLTVYRILKESLANVRRHAQASRIVVRLTEVDGSLELRVLDDGVGITERKSKGLDSFGLIGMSERAERAGGKVEVQRRGEGGTEVRAVIPVSPPKPGAE
jgi:two-component system sensor histidine kinase UhpB